MGNLLAQHAAIYASPRLAAPAMGFCCYTFLYVAILTLLPPETPATHRALIAAGMPLVSIAVSLTLGVWLLGRMSAVRLVQAGYRGGDPRLRDPVGVLGAGGRDGGRRVPAVRRRLASCRAPASPRSRN